MPYRRLPNTDQSRLKALKTAVETGKNKSVKEIAYSQALLVRARAFYPVFEDASIMHKNAKKKQSKASRGYQEILKKARLYLSHYMQILNFCIIRGEMKPEARECYGIDKSDGKVPSLALESEVLEWGKRIIEGDKQRVIQGGNALYNPSIAVVKVKYEQFVDAYHYQKTLQKNSTRLTRRVAELREEADEIILSIWNEVEMHYRNLPGSQKRSEAMKYGVSYFYRPRERRQLEAYKYQRNAEYIS